MPSRTDYAWAAGIIDGEGTIAMTRQRPGVNKRTTLGFQVRITVVMTHRSTIRRLRRLFGGLVAPAAKPRSSKHKPAYRWYAGDVLAEAVLKKITRYMITKRFQAALVLKYRRRCCATHSYRSCPADLIQLRLRYFIRLRALNRKGPR
jgi:hypothetical protein